MRSAPLSGANLLAHVRPASWLRPPLQSPPPPLTGGGGFELFHNKIRESASAAMALPSYRARNSFELTRKQVAHKPRLLLGLLIVCPLVVSEGDRLGPSCAQLSPCAHLPACWRDR
jgi:hypothetical protein